MVTHPLLCKSCGCTEWDWEYELMCSPPFFSDGIDILHYQSTKIDKNPSKDTINPTRSAVFVYKFTCCDRTRIKRKIGEKILSGASIAFKQKRCHLFSFPSPTPKKKFRKKKKLKNRKWVYINPPHKCLAPANHIHFSHRPTILTIKLLQLCPSCHVIWVTEQNPL